VDDENALRTVAVGALRRMGFTTLEARDGLEAVLTYQEHWDQIRLILLDLTMPRMGGEEACRELRRAGATVPILLTSGFGSEEALQRFRVMAPAGFLQKPYRIQELADAVRNALGSAGGVVLRGRPPREPVAWIHEFDTGEPLLDHQHKDLVRAFNNLVAATEGPAEATGRAYARFQEVLVGHCATEEGQMAASAFPGCLAHKSAHQRMLNQVEDLGEQLRAGTLACTPQVLDCLEDLLLTHMQLEDLELARHLRGRPGSGA